MEYKLNVLQGGGVEVIEKAGSCFVKTTYPEGMAMAFINKAKEAKNSDRYDGFIVLNGGEMFISGKIIDSEKETSKREKKGDK